MKGTDEFGEHTAFPRKAKGKNINSLTEKAKIVMKYNGPKTIALWALEMDKPSVCPLDTMMMTGDVSGAFHNIPLAADSCGCSATRGAIELLSNLRRSKRRFPPRL